MVSCACCSAVCCVPRTWTPSALATSSAVSTKPLRSKWPTTRRVSRASSKDGVGLPLLLCMQVTVLLPSCPVSFVTLLLQLLLLGLRSYCASQPSSKCFTRLEHRVAHWASFTRVASSCKGQGGQMSLCCRVAAVVSRTQGGALHLSLKLLKAARQAAQDGIHTHCVLI